MKIERIILTTDFSENSEAAIPAAISLAEKFGAQINVAHVIEDLAHYGVVEGIAFDTQQWSDAIDKNRKTQLEALVRRLANQTTAYVSGTCLYGNTIKELVKHVKPDSDLLVIATHGRTGLSHVVLGSIAEKVVRMSPCPVMTVPSKKP